MVHRLRCTALQLKRQWSTSTYTCTCHHQNQNTFLPSKCGFPIFRKCDPTIRFPNRWLHASGKWDDATPQPAFDNPDDEPTPLTYHWHVGLDLYSGVKLDWITWGYISHWTFARTQRWQIYCQPWIGRRSRRPDDKGEVVLQDGSHSARGKV